MLLAIAGMAMAVQLALLALVNAMAARQRRELQR